MTSFTLYVVKSLQQKPLQLKKDRGQNRFHAELGHSDFFVLFARGDWDKRVTDYSVSLVTDGSTLNIGNISSKNRAFYWTLTQTELPNCGLKSKKEKQSFTILVKPVEANPPNQEMIEGDKFTKISNNVKEHLLDATCTKEHLHNLKNSSLKDKNPPKQPKTGNLKTGRKRKKEVENIPPSADLDTTPIQDGVKATLANRRLRLSEKHINTKQEQQCTPAKRLPFKVSSTLMEKDWPSARWGHTLCRAGGNHALLIGGQGAGQTISRDSIWQLDTESLTWSIPECDDDPDRPQSRMGHTATYDSNANCIYVYGGSKNLKWFKDVHVLDLEKNEWSFIETSGIAPTRAYHSCTIFRNELYVFGGVYPNPDPQPDGCSNTLHIYSPANKGWYQPVVLGDKPQARSGHSATLMENQLVIFGGWDAPECFNNLHILDLGLMEFSSPCILGTPPSPRSWHASCAISNDEILIHGGYDGNNALSDAFIFSLGQNSWRKVELKSKTPVGPRAGHTLLKKQAPGKSDSKLIMFGGGDNEDSFFQDLIEVEYL